MPFYSYALAWLAGCLILNLQSDLPDEFWVSYLPLLLLFPFYRSSARWWLLLVAGLLWSLLFAHSYFQQVLPEAWAGQDVQVTGQVLDVPQLSSHSVRFELAVEPGAMPAQRLRLSWYGKADQRPQPRAGERWQLTVRLKPPHGSANPGGFDYEMWLYQHGVHATGYVREAESNRRLRAAAVWSVDAWRQRIAEQINHEQRPYAGLLMALAVGYGGAMDTAQWDDLLLTGTHHLMSISGLHVGMIAALVYWLALRMLPVWWLRRHAAQPSAALLALLAAAVYSALAGFAIPTQRTLIMLAVVLGAVVLRRPLQPVHGLSLALLLVLILDPLAVLSPGFWFSFLAVAAMAWGLSGRMGRGNLWWRFGHVHVLVTLALFPLSLFLFQQTSLIAPLANFFMVPWVSLVVVPLVLLGALLLMLPGPMAQWLFDLADLCLQAAWPILHTLAELPLASWIQPAPSTVAMLLASIGVVWLLSPRGLPGRWLGALMLLPALLVATPKLPEQQFSATVIDVGQGLSVLVQTREHTLLFDAGPRFGEDSDAGERMVLPYLRHRGIQQLDKLVISNGDADHIGGANFILHNLSVLELTGQDLASLPHAHKTACATGQRWNWDGVSFEFLHPDVPDKKRNNHSCVLKIDNGYESLLIAADIEKKIEYRLLYSQLEKLSSTVLVVPHHGSKSSSISEFIAEVRPDYALISAGYRNRFGHPKADVVQRYLDAGAKVLVTANNGAVEILFDQTAGMSAQSYRHEVKKYWHWKPQVMRDSE